MTIMMEVIDISGKPAAPLHETFRNTRKCAATCRKLSGAPENLLHPCDKLSGVPENPSHPCMKLSGKWEAML